MERQEARRDVGAFVFVKTRFVRFGLDDVDALEVAHAHREARAARRRRAVSRESVSSRVRLLAHEQAGRSHAEHGVEALRYDVRFLRRDEKNGVGVFVAGFFRFLEPVGAVGFESLGARGEARERHEARAIAVLAETIRRFDDSRRRALVHLQPRRLRAEERREPAIPRNRLNRASDAPREIEARPKIARDVVHADVARPARLERETHQNQRPVRVGLHGLDRRVDVTRRARGIHPAAPRGRPTPEPPRVHASAERRDAQKRAGVVHVHARHGAVRLVVRQRVARRAAGLARLDHARAAARPEHARATRAERERLRADVGSRGDRSRHLGGLLGRAFSMLRDARWVVRESPDAFEPVPTVHVRLGVLVGPDEQSVAGDVGAENLPRAFPRLKRARRKRAHRALHEHLVAGEVRQAHAVAYLVRQTHAGQDVRGETRV